MKKTGLALIEGEPGLARELSSSAVISTDTIALSAYRTRKQRETKIGEAIQEMDSVRRELHDIKSMLQQLLNKE